MHPSNLAEVQRLLTYLQEQAVDSHNIAITPEEATTLASCLLERLVFKFPLLDEIIQEELDNLRYQIYSHKTDGVNKFSSELEHYSSSTASEV
jgi:hypothetical protein